MLIVQIVVFRINIMKGSPEMEEISMKKMKHVLTGIVLLLTCVFLFAAQPALADEVQGLNEPGNIRNAAQEFADSASRFIIGRQVRMRSSASASEENVIGEYKFGEPVQVVAELGEWLQVRVTTNAIIREASPRFVHRDFVGSWEQVENKMKKTSPYMIELDRLGEVIFCISYNGGQVWSEKERAEKMDEINYYRHKIPGIHAYIAGSGLPQATMNEMLEALDIQKSLLDVQEKRLDKPAAGEASAGLFEMMNRKLKILNEKYL